MRALAGIILAVSASMGAAALAADAPDPALVRFQWGVKIPMRDGVKLNATAYIPANQKAPAPCVFTLTPYISQTYHDRGMYFAANGYPFFTVDVRGRGNSEGVFRPFIQEGADGHDVVEWLAKQGWCNGKVTMWGGSYAGYNQWMTAAERPPHLATIVPVASPYAGVDFPMSDNIKYPYEVQWSTYTSGKASQAAIFGDAKFWASNYKRWYDSGTAFRNIDTFIGNPLPWFQEWVSHPEPDAFWDGYNPTRGQYAALTLPILTITGMYDGDQPGAIEHYRKYMSAANAAGRARHWLIIGPWDHAGTRTPKDEVGGIKFGPDSLLDLPKLHLDWYKFTMQGGPKPAFLKKPVAYYVTGAEKWRYAETLDGITAEMRPLYLQSAGGAANDVLASGSLAPDTASGAADSYVYDPRDLSLAEIEAKLDTESLVDQTLLYAMRGKALVYHSAPFAKDTELSGFFKFSAWIAIDQPDTDFAVNVSEVRADGSVIPLASDAMRARYREDRRTPRLVTTREPQLYEFKSFTFASREVKAGSRLRLVFAPVNSIYSEKNYNSGGVVADETVNDARSVTVKLFHDAGHPSALYLPIAAK